jgi:hypothetical protein
MGADSPAFDLTGPKVDVHVKRGDLTLPIGQVPNLLPGDRIWVHPDFPESQSAHYILVVAFLRGATNPPPPDWFTRVETWTRASKNEGVFVTVPKEAQQALAFLVPETGGDFSTLRKAVHDRPGAFVRATQNLQAAGWDRMRLDTYLNEVRNSSQSDAKVFKEKAELSARSLGVRLDQECFDKPIDQQASCLSQHTEGMVLDDANAQSLVAQLATGSTVDLMNQLSYSTMAGAGQFSPYVGAIVDTAKILASLHTAHFQYIPALALPIKDTLNLRLNLPPSFRDPKSVVVIALPPVGSSKAPQLRASNPLDGLCAQKPDLVFAAEGAPLVFGTNLAHNLELRIETGHGSVNLPLSTAPSKGGLVLQDPLPALPPGEMTGVVQGKWGFDDWEGPRFPLFSAGPGKWALAADDQTALIVGRDDALHIKGVSTLCVSSVSLRAPEGDGNPLPLKWKAARPDVLEVSVPLKDATPRTLLLEIHQFGMGKPDTLDLDAYAEAASLEHLTLSAGDRGAMLKGTRLDEVAKVTLNGITWKPEGLARVQDFDQLTLTTEGSTLELDPAKSYSARVELRDGRQLKVPVTVNLPRPQVTLLSKGTQEDSMPSPSPVHMGSPDDLPLDARLVFFLKSVVPQSFPRNQTVEVAAEDGSFRTVLSLADGSLMLEDAKTALGTVEPLARFGPSAFGPLRTRAVSANGVAGDWIPLGTLVRLPALKELRCPHVASRPCTLTGTNLFLAASVAATEDFGNAIDIPPDFTGGQVAVPHPLNGNLFLKLRDDPQTVQTLSMPVTLVPPATQPSGPTAGVQGQPTAPAVPAGSAKPENASPPKPDNAPPAKPEDGPPPKPDN